jgi:hypothetical protein
MVVIMVLTESRKYACLKINDPASAQQIICDVVNEICSNGEAIDRAGTISNLINTYLKCYEVLEIQKITTRIEALEATKLNGGY